MGCLFTGLAMAEICSTYPQSGSVYYWTGQMAPPSWAPYLSFMVGWINFLGNMANSTSFANGCITILASAVTMKTGAVLSVGVQVALSLVLLTFWCLQNCLRIDQQGWITAASAACQVIGSFALVIATLGTRTPSDTASEVFFFYYNGTGIDSVGYVSCLGVLVSLYCYGGFEAGSHLAEETRNASKVAPRGIVYCMIISFLTGLFLILGFLYCTPTDKAALELGYPSGVALLLDRPCTDPTCGGLDPSGNTPVNASFTGPGTVGGQALVNLFWFTAGENGGFALALILAFLVYLSGMASVTSVSRMIFSMARDNAFPFSKHLRKVNEKTKSPVYSILVTFICQGLLLLLPLGSSTAFVQITAMSSIGFQLSYGIPIFLKLTTGRKVFQPNWFNLGRLSEPVGWVAVGWIICSTVILFFPQEAPINASNMNYAIAIIPGLLFLATIYWVVAARFSFNGPIREGEIPSSP